MLSLHVPSPGLNVFSDSYNFARQAWLDTSRNLGRSLGDNCRSVEYLHASLDPGGARLATDVLWLGKPQASRVVVLISGTHGVEGFVGSAIQQAVIAAFRAGELGLPTDTALLFVHALNPWGYAWCRRGDELGVDLNRNFIDFSHTPEPCPDFVRLRPWLLEAGSELRRDGLALLRRELGDTRFEVALSGGQYTDPDAPFYGGRAASHGRQVIERLLQDFELVQRDLLVLDLHSGLGPWGYGELICDHPADSPGARQASKTYGPAIAIPASGNSCSVPKLGLMDYCWHAIMNDRSCFLTLEFGSYGTDALFDCLIAEQMARGKQSFEDWLESPRRRQVQEHFCPSDTQWRELVLYRSLQVVHQGLAGTNYE